MRQTRDSTYLLTGALVVCVTSCTEDLSVFDSTEGI